MEHNVARHKLSEYIDGSITADEKAEIETHLKTCSACGNALQELHKAVEHIKSVEDVEPPAGMTQKSMVNVNAGEVERKSLIRRFFFPLSVKLPIQAAAVLFLTVIAFSIYKNIQPASVPSEAPMNKITAGKEASPAPTLRDKRGEPKITKDTSVQPKHAPQAPGYKALDMKQEYEKPALPAVPGKVAESAPAPSKAEEQPLVVKKKAAMEGRPAVAQAGSPAMMQEQSTTIVPQMQTRRESTYSARKAKTLPPVDKAGGCLSYEPKVVNVTGVVRRVNFPGQPNFKNTANGDKRETYWIVKLDKAVCVFADKGDKTHEPESEVKELQLLMDPSQYEQFRTLLSTPVTVKGTLLHATTGRHHTSVLITVREISKK